MNEATAPLHNYRWQAILKTLTSRGECQVAELAREFNLSGMTLRRDLKELEARGLLQRVRGGAVAIGHDVAYYKRAHRDQTHKQLIGARAAQLVRDGMAIYLDSGTTAMELARAIRRGLPGVRSLSIMTHGVNVALELIGNTPYTLHLVGGEIYQNGISTVGPLALAQIASFHFNLFFMGAQGVDAKAGWTNSNHPEAQVKHVAMSHSAEVCAIVGKEKWGARAFSPIAPLDRVSTWVVDAGLPEAAAAAARAAGIELIVAS
jgi:DeoR/GlpR family transcriptional regulator of sugar metabolism